MTNTTHPNTNFLVWAEIPVTDFERAIAFYNDVLQIECTINNDGPNPMADFPNTETSSSAHLYPGKPAPEGTGSTVHLRVSGDLNDAMDRVGKAGGQVVSPIITIPPGSFFYALDLDGNSIGLFSLAK
jgi:hypothetical protein